MYNLIKNQRSILVDKLKLEVSKFGLDDSKYFKTKQVRVMVATWNVGGFKPPSYKDIASMFTGVSEHNPEVIVVGLQEIFEMKSRNIGRILNITQTATRTTRWRFLISQCLAAIAPYSLVWEDDLAGIHVLVFAASSIVDNIKNITSTKMKMGILGMANKGSVIIQLSIYDTPFKFAVCHLNAGCAESDTESRIEQINELLQGDFCKDVVCQ